MGEILGNYTINLKLITCKSLDFSWLFFIVKIIVSGSDYVTEGSVGGVLNYN